MRVPQRRSDWLLGRWTAKSAVAARLGVPVDAKSLSALEIRAASSGQPEAYLEAAPLAVSISISHRAGVALCTVGPGRAEVGCDLEQVEERSDAFVADYFTVEEQAQVARAPASERPLLINLFWSAKESALKALHEGLRLDTRSVNVEVVLIEASRDETSWQPLRVRLRDGGEFCGRWRQEGSTLRTIVARASSLEVFPINLASAGANCHTEFQRYFESASEAVAVFP